MKFNLCTFTLVAMTMGVSAHPAEGKASPKGAVIRQAGKGAVGDVFRRAGPWGGFDFSSYSSNSPEEDEEDEDEDEDEDEEDSSDDSDDSSEDSDDSSASASAAVGDYTYPAATKTTISYASATGSGSGSQTTGSGSSSGSGSSGSSGGSLPDASGTTALGSCQTVAAGETFDGGMVMYDRGVECEGQTEGGESDAVFQIENGGTLKNVIIGPNQIEGVHCQGSCTLENVWWSAVCEDAFSIKNQEAGETTTVNGGGAFGAADKVVQHNGGGSVVINDFTVSDFGKLYRSCGNCDSMYERHVTINGATATNGDLLAGINSNYGDTATISSSTLSGVSEVCETFEGNDSGDEPTSISTGNDGTNCIIDSSVSSE